LRGTFVARFAARDILEESVPDAKAERILAMMEEKGEVA